MTRIKGTKNLLTYLACLTFIALLSACGGGGSSDGGQGTLTTSLTDASTEDYQAVYVTIARVDVHHDDDEIWETVATPEKTYNLLELVNGIVAQLGEVLLDSGHYTQMRLIIGEESDQGLNIFDQPHPYANYIIDLDDMAHELTVPSGSQTGLKIVNGFDINTNQTTELILDFDALRSVVKAGSSGKYLLKPTIKVLSTADYAIVYGTVSEAGTNPLLPLGNTFITAQIAASEEADVKDQVVIQSGTLATENGEYALFLEPGDYNLVAHLTGYQPICRTVSLGEDSTSMVDLSLIELSDTELTGTIFGLVNITDPVEDQHATLEFRQIITCNGSDNAQMIIVKSVEIAHGGSYEVALAPGEYQVVVTSYGKETMVIDALAVVSEEFSERDINL